VRLEVLTLPFDPDRGGFDVTALDRLQRGSRVTSCREHFFEAGGRPWLTVVAECVPAVENAPPSSPPSPHIRATLSAAAAAPPADLAPVSTPPASASSPADTRRPSTTAAAESLPPEHRALFEHLRRWRFETAKRAGVPPYVVLTNRQLLEVVTARPSSKGGLAKIPGIGRKTVENHGDSLLRAMQLGQGFGPTAITAATPDAAEIDRAAPGIDESPAHSDAPPAAPVASAEEQPA
jgi:hypothetical protein